MEDGGACVRRTVRAAEDPGVEGRLAVEPVRDAEAAATHAQPPRPGVHLLVAAAVPLVGAPHGLRAARGWSRRRQAGLVYLPCRLLGRGRSVQLDQLGLLPLLRRLQPKQPPAGLTTASGEFYHGIACPGAERCVTQRNVSDRPGWPAQS